MTVKDKRRLGPLGQFSASLHVQQPSFSWFQGVLITCPEQFFVIETLKRLDKATSFEVYITKIHLSVFAVGNNKKTRKVKDSKERKGKVHKVISGLYFRSGDQTMLHKFPQKLAQM